MTKRLVVRSILVTILGITAVAMSARGALACGFVVDVLGGAALAPFQSQQNDLKIHSKNGTDLVTVRLTIDPGATFDWHTHPGWTFAIVESGNVKLTRLGRQGCRSETFPGEGGFFEATNEVHKAENLSDVEARLLVTFVLRNGEPLVDFLEEDEFPDCD
jgi:quercetin dioxygenase-like cupin family protein